MANLQDDVLDKGETEDENTMEDTEEVSIEDVESDGEDEETEGGGEKTGESKEDQEESQHQLAETTETPEEFPSFPYQEGDSQMVPDEEVEESKGECEVVQEKGEDTEVNGNSGTPPSPIPVVEISDTPDKTEASNIEEDAVSKRMDLEEKIHQLRSKLSHARKLNTSQTPGLPVVVVCSVKLFYAISFFNVSWRWYYCYWSTHFWFPFVSLTWLSGQRLRKAKESLVENSFPNPSSTSSRSILVLDSLPPGDEGVDTLDIAQSELEHVAADLADMEEVEVPSAPTVPWSYFFLA